MSQSIQCPECDKVFSKQSKLDRHFTLHSKEKNVQCPFCPARYTRKEHLSRHLLSHNENEQDRKPFVCEVEGCGKRFAHRYHMKRHVLLHSTSKPFKVKIFKIQSDVWIVFIYRLRCKFCKAFPIKKT